MQYTINSGAIAKQRTDLLIINVCNGQVPRDAGFKALDQSTDGLLSKLIKRGDVGTSFGASCLIPDTGSKAAAARILLINCGDDCDMAPSQYVKLMQAVFKATKGLAIKDMVLATLDIPVKDSDMAWKILQSIWACASSLYQFDTFKKTKPPQPTLKKLTLAIADNAKHRQAVKEAKAIVNGMATARTLGDTPPNVCTPTYLASAARQLANKHAKMSAKILNEAQMAKLGMHLLLSVSQGSKQGAKLIILEYKGAAKTEKPLVLVGKGITFDTGGINLKPSANMEEMKYDMMGAASVLGAIQAAAEIGVKQNIVAIVAAAENFPAYEATKPSDIIKSMSGQTVEILNTDAEGRLILADALTYAERYKPKAVLTVATLTGAIIVALGNHTTGLFTDNDKLAHSLSAAGDASFDRVWRLPIWECYQEMLKNDFADMGNISKGPGAGSITAACFLSRFASAYDWAHLDVAGTAFGWQTGIRGATGRPVPLLTRFLLDYK